MKTVFAAMLVVLVCMTIIPSCGDGGNLAKQAVENAIGSYAKSILGDIDTDQARDVLQNRLPELCEKAVDVYFNYPEVKGLPYTERIRESIITAYSMMTTQQTEEQNPAPWPWPRPTAQAN